MYGEVMLAKRMSDVAYSWIFSTKSDAGPSMNDSSRYSARAWPTNSIVVSAKPQYLRVRTRALRTSASAGAAERSGVLEEVGAAHLREIKHSLPECSSPDQQAAVVRIKTKKRYSEAAP